ncbi:hypothetical protein [Niastella sp. OAS944]|uniref:hypothetical protein n=1 Tax=Niastella sp. OAS944 TaxID=2664089 RepID=UPI00349764A2|nr:hypothetical protein [Chitinophagaceae bacterium OAS944]
MKPVKIVIEIKNHTIQFVFASAAIQYVIINYDDLDKGLHPISVPLEPEIIQEPLFSCYAASAEEDAQQAEVRESLKRLNF